MVGLGFAKGDAGKEAGAIDFVFFGEIGADTGESEAVVIELISENHDLSFKLLGRATHGVDVHLFRLSLTVMITRT